MNIETPATEKRHGRPAGARRGLVIVHNGNGTAAFGLALRAHGRGKGVKVYQFMMSRVQDWQRSLGYRVRLGQRLALRLGPAVRNGRCSCR